MAGALRPPSLLFYAHPLSSAGNTEGFIAEDGDQSKKIMP
jgi:hypothetical protein